MKSKFLIILLILLNYGITAQVCTIETVEICAGQEVLIPVTGKTLQNIGALTLYIGFDTNNLNFLGIENVDSQLDGMSVNLMSNPAQLAFAWSNTDPISFFDEKLFDIKFLANENTSLLNFNSGCELSDTDGVVIATAYVNGALNYGMPEITSNPEDTSIIEGGTAYFYMTSLNTISYLWRESQDGGISWVALDNNEVYSGTNTNSLVIKAVPLTYNNYLYQCIAYHNNCQINTDFAKLSVDKFSGVNNELEKINSIVAVEPVIFHDNTNIRLALLHPCNVKLQILNSLGKIVMDMVFPSLDEGNHYINLNASNWKSGIYFLNVQCIFPESCYDAVLKIIRN